MSEIRNQGNQGNQGAAQSRVRVFAAQQVRRDHGNGIVCAECRATLKRSRGDGEQCAEYNGTEIKTISARGDVQLQMAMAMARYSFIQAWQQFGRNGRNGIVCAMSWR